jgi:hypothetical protein
VTDRATEFYIITRLAPVIGMKVEDTHYSEARALELATGLALRNVGDPVHVSRVTHILRAERPAPVVDVVRTQPGIEEVA